MKNFISHTMYSCILLSSIINACDFQEKYTNMVIDENLIHALHLKLKSSHYRKEILPNDFSYLIDLIESGVAANQSPTYLRSVIKLFSNLLKDSDYVNAREFLHLLETLPITLPHYFTLNLSTHYLTNQGLLDAYIFDRFNATVNDMLYFKFSTDYDAFKKNPTLFLSNISTDIVNIAQEEVACEQLRQSLVRFCEIALSKLLWNFEEQEQTWHVTKKIADQLATLLERNILDDANDLDDLYWTLLYRYSYFVELMAIDMKNSFYDSIKRDIANEPITLFELEEQDSLIESKQCHLIRTLVEAEAKASTYHNELIKS